jgi:four helix bundle protein
MIKNFEEIEAWQMARELTKAVYAVVQSSSFSHDFGLRDQIRRASVSIMANIAEGFERDGNKEFVQYLSQAKGSSAEVRSHLYVALDARYIDQQTFDTLSNLTVRIGKALACFIKHLRSSDLSGIKFRHETQKPETRNQKPETRNHALL